MKLELKNNELIIATELLAILNLKGKDSRIVNKLSLSIREALENLSKDEQTLGIEIGVIDKDTNEQIPVSQLPQSKIVQFNKEQQVLYNEVVTFDGGSNRKQFDLLPAIFSKYNETIPGKYMNIFDKIATQLEEQEESGNDY